MNTAPPRISDRTDWHLLELNERTAESRSDVTPLEVRRGIIDSTAALTQQLLGSDGRPNGK